MAYIVINAQMFTACFAGSLAGMGVSGRMLDDTNTSDYDNEVLTANAIAQEFDTLWNDASSVRNLEIELTHQAFEALFQNRNPPVDGDVFSPSSYEQQCRVIIAIIQRSLALYTVEGYPNPASGGGGSQTWGETLANGNTSDGKDVLMSTGDVIEDQNVGGGLNFRTKAGVPGTAPGLMFVSCGDAQAGQFGGTWAGQSGRVSGGGARCTWLYGSPTDTRGGLFQFNLGGAGEGGDVDSGMFGITTANKGGTGTQGHVYVDGPGAFFGLEALPTMDPTIVVPGYWARSSDDRGMYRDQAGVDHILAYDEGVETEIVARMATVSTLPAATYDNGTAGVGRTLSFVAGPVSIDGIVPQVGDIILIHHAAGGDEQNGVYEVTSYISGGATVFTGVAGFDNAADLPGGKVYVRLGSRLGQTSWTYLNRKTPVMGTTRIFYWLDEDLAGYSAIEQNDFANGTTVAVTAQGFGGKYWNGLSIGTGAGFQIGPGAAVPQSLVPNNSASVFGIWTGTAGSLASGVYGIQGGGFTAVGTAAQGGDSILIAQNMGYRRYFRAGVTGLSDATQEYADQMGLFGQRNQQQHTPNDMIGFTYARLQFGTAWLAIARSGGTSTGTSNSTGLTVVAGELHDFEIWKDIGDNDHIFYVDGVQVASYNTNIPSVLLSMLCMHFKTAGGSPNNGGLMGDAFATNTQWPQGRY